MNETTTWRQGAFIDQAQYSRMSDDWKAERRREEALLVRSGPLANAICKARDPETAKWIAGRLNLAAQLEQMTYDFATGKSDGSEIVALVRHNVGA